MNEDGSRGPAAPLLWAVLTLVALPLAFLTAFVTAHAVIVGMVLPDISAELRLDLAIFIVLFGALGSVAVVGAARLAFGEWPRVPPRVLMVAAIGIALAVAEELALHEWAEASTGYYDWDMIGWTAALSLLMALAAIGALAVLIAPRGAGAFPAAATLLVLALIAIVVVSNVPGLMDGIESESWGLAILIGLCAAYAIGVVAIVARRLRR